MTTKDTTTQATTDEKTITVEGYFNKMKTLNKEDFQSRWTASVTDLYSVTNDMADHHAVTKIVDQVFEMAGRRFEAIHAKELAKEQDKAHGEAMANVMAKATA